jgi:iron(III) transport system substrate-binding protein
MSRGGNAMPTTKRLSALCVAFFLCVSLVSASGPMAAFAASKEMIAAAIKEGEVSWLDAMCVPSSAKVFGEAFKKEYGLPDTFKVNHQTLGTGPLSTRVAEEVKANRITIDVFGASVPTFFADLKDANALLNYDSPEYKNFSQARKVGLPNEPGYWQAAIAQIFAPITNPKIYSKQITSWYDLLDPALKGGKISFPAVASGGGPLYCYVGWRKVLPKSFFVDVSKQQVAFDRGSAVDATQRLTQGETFVAITSAFRIMQTAEQSGVDLVAHFPKEGLLLLGQPYGILAKAPHPNAARLFVDFMFSEKGNRLFIDLEGVIAIRDGMKAPDKIRKYSPPISEINAIPLDWKNLDSQTLNQFQEEFKEIFR